MTGKYLYFNSRDEFFRVDTRAIVYFEADGNYTHFVLCNGQRGTVCMSLMQMQELLTTHLKEEAHIFARVGKRFIVNLSFVYHINSQRQQLTLSDGIGPVFQIALSKEALKRLKELFVGKLKA